MAFIEISAISKSFGSFQALRDISLSVAEQEFVTFLGPSGCGKTTMLRTLAGFHAPELGHDPCRRPADVIAAGDRPAGNAPHGHGVPELRRVAAHVRIR